MSGHDMRLRRDDDGHLRPACVCGWESATGVIPSHPAADAALLRMYDDHRVKP